MNRQAHRIFVAVAVALTIFLSGAAQAALVHHWTFDEPDGTASPQVKDTVLVGTRDGTFQGALTDAARSLDVPVGIGSTRSLNFGSSNVNNYVDVYGSGPNSYIILGNNTDFTVSLWYKGTDAGGATVGGGERTLIGSSAGHANLELRSGKVVYTHYNGGYVDNVISTVDVNDNAWHNIVLVNHVGQTADLYVDAVAQVTGVSSTVSTNVAYRIGSFMTGPGTAGNYTSGLLDDVRIYDNSLTQADVNAIVGVPEPASLALLGCGVIGLLRRRRI